MKLFLAFWMAATAIAGAAALTAARHEQQTTERPGELTKGRMYIENRGKDEAIPVRLEEVASPSPVRVVITRQIWEYRAAALKAQDDWTRALTALGLEGWEATGLEPTVDGGIVVLLKRPVGAEAH